MRLLELEIRDIRGIRHLELSLGGKSAVILGANGSGKSGIVDAIDFVLTGRIDRLTGRGTGGITLGRHGPHILSDPAHAEVRAVFQCADVAEPITLRRRIADPDNVECDRDLPPSVVRALELAKQRQHTLTRRDILRFITAEAGSRAEEVQELLSLRGLIEIRKAMTSAESKLKKERDAAVREAAQARQAVCLLLDGARLDDAEILSRVNVLRKTLGAEALIEASAASVRRGVVVSNAMPRTEAPATPRLSRAWMQDRVDAVARLDAALRASLVSVRAEQDAQRILARDALTKRGLALLGDDRACPLCETHWDSAALRALLDARVAKAASIVETHRAVEDDARALRVTAGELAKALDHHDTPPRALPAVGRALRERLAQRLAELADPLRYADDDAPLFGRDIAAAIDAVGAHAESTDAPATRSITAEERAWETLTRIEGDLARLETAAREAERATAAHGRAEGLVEAFEGARDETLTSIYKAVEGRFVSLYRRLNGDDEGTFRARLAPDGAALELEVDFHEKGLHPPQALHSEGHQDSMGVCLYLALAELLTKGTLDIIVLDDVVATVDSGHRRELCRALKTELADKQFILTTHDRMWANELKSEGVVTSANVFDIASWGLETGPRVRRMKGSLEAVEEAAARDVRHAAGMLRRELEAHFAEVCEGLGAAVRFRQDGRYELEHLLAPARTRLGQLVRQAKGAAGSWDQRAKVEAIGAFEKRFGAVCAKADGERWILNAIVHHNAWLDQPTATDFRPIFDAARELWGAFECAGCSGRLYVSYAQEKEDALRCRCGDVMWSLVEKGKGRA